MSGAHRGVFACLALGLVASPLAAQEAVPVHAPLIDYVVVGDTAARHVTLIAALAPQATVAGMQSGVLMSLGLPPVQGFQWATVVRRLVDSIGPHWKPTTVSLIGPPLDVTPGGTLIGIGADPQGPRGHVFFVMVNDTTGGNTALSMSPRWRVPATFADVDTLLGALRIVARDVMYRSLSLAKPTAGWCPPPADVVLPDTLDPLIGPPTPPRLVHHASMGPSVVDIGRSARVWMQFVVDTAGRVDPASVCEIFGDNADWARAVRDALPSFRFAPAILHQHPIAMVERQAFFLTVSVEPLR